MACRAGPPRRFRSRSQFDAARAQLVAGDALRRLGRRRLAAERIEAAGAEFARLGAGRERNAPSGSCAAPGPAPAATPS
jgi:hypothetical protein